MAKKKTQKADLATYVDKSDAKIAREKKTTIVEREIQTIVDEHQTCTPAMLLDSARDEKSPLHRFFEWDDSRAAEKYRIAQATQMILATKFVCVLQEQNDIVPKIVHAEEHTKHLVRKFLPAHGRGEGFVTRNSVLSDAEMRTALVERKRGELETWCRSVVDIAELGPIRGVILDALRGSVAA
jgi:hypothetical protein